MGYKILMIVFLAVMAGCASPAVRVDRAQIQEASRLVDTLTGDEEVKKKIQNSLLQADDAILYQDKRIQMLERKVQEYSEDAGKFRAYKNAAMIAGFILIAGAMGYGARKIGIL